MNSTAWTWILQLATTITVGVIAFWMKDWKSKTESQIAKNETEIKNVEKALNDFKNQMPYNYTLREDSIRSMANLEKRLEKMDSNFEVKFEKINSSMEKKLDDFFEMFGNKIDKMEEHLNEHILKKEG
ncbi:MAG: hypothetical protein Q8920_04410 [Bacillota bacterium]|nr:hypothetical protein [Bacillota bacterium]